jgi:hypothetical protein
MLFQKIYDSKHLEIIQPTFSNWYKTNSDEYIRSAKKQKEEKGMNCNNFNLEEFEIQACQTIEFPRLAISTGNAIAVFTMLVLQEIIKQQTVNPIANLSSIVALSNSIATLNSSIKFIQ